MLLFCIQYFTYELDNLLTAATTMFTATRLESAAVHIKSSTFSTQMNMLN